MSETDRHCHLRFSMTQLYRAGGPASIAAQPVAACGEDVVCSLNSNQHAAPMNPKPKRDHDAHGRILPFNPRRPPPYGAFSNLTSHQSPVGEFDQYQSAGSGDDDYRHRMKMNALALLVLIVLIAGGMWIVDVMAQMRKNQDCVLSGGRNCAAVTEQPRAR